jgi:hypothetical protein
MRLLAVAWFILWAMLSLPWNSASTTAQWDRVRPARLASLRVRVDHALNFLFYVPLVPLGSRLGWSTPASIATGAILSATAETAQLFSTERSPDPKDLSLNIAGTLVGAGLLAAVRSRAR